LISSNILIKIKILYLMPQSNWHVWNSVYVFEEKGTQLGEVEGEGAYF